MAVIQYTGIVNQVRGKLNGSVFNKSRGVNTLQRKQQQPKGTRGNQSVVRGNFNQVQRNWKLLSPSVRQAWALVAQNNPDRNRFGDQVILSAYNKYIQCFMNVLYNGSSLASPPPTAPAEPLNVVSDTVNSLTLTPQLDGSVVAATDVFLGLSSPRNFGLGVAISLPISTGVTAYHRRYVSVGSVSHSGAGGSFSLSGNIGSFYPTPQAGQKVIVRMQAVTQGSGVVVFTSYHEIIF